MRASYTSIIPAIKDRVSLSEVMQKYSCVELKRRGNRSVGCCPFHEEKTGSFTVYEEEKGKWYCFGCHKGGDAIDFARETLGLSLHDTLKRIAVDFGIAGDDRSYMPVKPKRSAKQVLKLQYFGIIDLLLLDRRELQIRLREYIDPDQIPEDMVHNLGRVEGLLDELFTGSTADKAAALLRGRAYLYGGHWQRTA